MFDLSVIRSMTLSFDNQDLFKQSQDAAHVLSHPRVFIGAGGGKVKFYDRPGGEEARKALGV